MSDRGATFLEMKDKRDRAVDRLRRIELPRFPTWVSITSGGGIHAVWALDEDRHDAYDVPDPVCIDIDAPRDEEETAAVTHDNYDLFN